MAEHFLAALNLLNAPVLNNTSPLVKKGNNRDYSYEIWNTEDSIGYYLKVSRSGKHPFSQAPQIVGSFKTPQDAFNYLDTNYR
ncbi:hypothetical protein DSM106972_084540 [Dulcicalothrix desertica PCC 7102]|uniref:Uncharacterized protein n=1 Tax=Dulcicalothrix desertica PCC 7102 TaxID=232991 RepID=A0A433UUK8_9CYAN|nr:hypothetical protein [Dulcicalothrix desertica]RUS97506.1 hypothetical protein DSM106972_084540 [Dulcicalothrix desertica PCC 7102]TWH62106.1 hypothetical protein CAL7102_00803 [Dulcicalothrix desertica PCC 7102]